MAAFQNFRSAVGGFNREDVVRYIEYINNKHASQVNQLKTELQTLQEELNELRSQPQPDPTLPAQLEAALAKSDALEQELAEVRAQLEAAAERPQTDSELEAYRRAERAERTANERVAMLYQQANGILADATVKADEAAAQISDITKNITAQLVQLQTALTSGANVVRDAATSLYAIRPATTEE